MKKYMLLAIFGSVAAVMASGCATARKVDVTVEKALSDAAAIAQGPCGVAVLNAAAVCKANPPRLP